MKTPIKLIFYFKLFVRYKIYHILQQILLHRLIFVAKLGQDITAPAVINFMENTYQRVLEESPNGQPREPITGLGIVYPTQAV